ncbi:DUF6705 family protein [Flavobacterium sp.]|uniref:DUF6705 family protein n=1 Tax=Flavobacterium sp. TaxID=239 RepID=UPI002603CD6C|nr:DUF6705 family protein [Flavobacterium sp.]
MKNILYTLLFFLLSAESYSQTEVDMAADATNHDIKSGTQYIKDINNYFGPFLGDWRYVDGNKEFRLHITKVSKTHIYFPAFNINYYTDELKIRYEKYESGLLIFSSPETDFSSGITKEEGIVDMTFIDYERTSAEPQLTLTLVPQTVQPHQLENRKILFKLDGFEIWNKHVYQPGESLFSVPNNIEMTWYPGP